MTRLPARTLFALVTAFAASACVVSSEDTESADNEMTSRSLTLATFNAGLVRGGVALVDERLPKIGPALRATDADVLCLQEVWGDEDYEHLRASLADTYPHAFRQQTEEDGKRWFSCNPFSLLSLKNCVDSTCTSEGVSAEECVQNACKEKYDALSQSCQICLAANTDSPTSCVLRANEFVQNGRNGLALFSRRPITDARFEDYGSTLVHRGLIRATVEGRSIVCTHLSSDLTTVPYPGGTRWANWREEQASEIDTVTTSLPSSGCRVILGDMNASRGAGTIRPELDTTLTAFSDKGYHEPWSSPVCTWCPPPANPLASGRDEKLYDHILVSNSCGKATYKRILDQPIDVEHDGQTLTTRLSDHFGLMVQLSR